ncbi:MAG: TerB N-terminal domain-containing protein [Tepidisphaerales bacterium]
MVYKFMGYVLLFLALVAVAIIIVAVRAMRVPEKPSRRPFVYPATAYRPTATSPAPSGPAPRPQPQYLRALQFFGAGESLQIGKLTITSPLAWFVDSRSGLAVEEPAAVDLGLPVTWDAATDRAALPFWPRYDRLTPNQRGIYLKWLADGRRRMPPEVGYLFLHLAGLERRSLIDRKDVPVAFDEVLRLRALVASADGAGSQRYESHTRNLLWFLAVQMPDQVTDTRVQSLLQSVASPSGDDLAAALSWHAARGMPLPLWMAFTIAENHADAQRSVVVQRVGQEFRQLFDKRYAEKFPGGMPLQPSRRPRKFAYRPANAALASLEFSAPNPMGLASQFNPLADIWNVCVEALRKLSSVRGRGGGTLTTAEWQALPDDIRKGVEHPLSQRFSTLIHTYTGHGPAVLVPVSELLAVIESGPGGKLTPASSRRLCETAAQIGYLLEPDARLAGKAYKPDERVAVLLDISNAPVEPARYTAAACMLRVGIAVASVDGAPGEEELAVLTQQVETSFELNDTERRRVEALRFLLVKQGADLSGLARIAKGLSEPHRQALAKLVLAIVAADGVVTKAELSAIRRTYTALGFDKSAIDRAIDSLAEPDHKAAQPQTAAVTEDKGFKLNHAAIAAILQDTQEVAQLLSQAMAGDDEPVSPEAVATATATPLPKNPVAHVTSAAAPPEPVQPSPADGPPARYAALYALLIAQDRWPLAEAEALARKQGHMLSGAVETINDWAFDKLGSQLFVEDGDTLLVQKELLK